MRVVSRVFTVLTLWIAILITPAVLAQAPATTGNQDSCQIGHNPAATLLLPYFEVDFQSPRTTARDTLFTIVNVSNTPAIAHITIWTDWSFPVLDFNVWLTGYDVQGISMYDIIARGKIPATSATSDKGDRSVDAPGGHLSASAISDCTDLPENVPLELVAALQQALTTGRWILGPCSRIGNVHANAIGYVTIDTARTCSQTLPNDPSYFLNEILFDNQLTGDYIDINPNPATGNYAAGNPLVALQAVPAGGPSGLVPTNLPRTFYQRYQGGSTADRRQPLPSIFTARYVSGGRGALQTYYKIWRQGPYSGLSCGSQLAQNGAFPATEFIRFDEHENPTTSVPCQVSPCPPNVPLFPETIKVQSDNSFFFPPLSSADIGGFMYMNLDNPTQPDVQQNWVIVEMYGEGRYEVDFDATFLENGCSPLTLGIPTAFDYSPAE